MKEQWGMPISCLVQVECHVRLTEGAARLQDEEVIAPLSAHGGGWDEEVTPLGLKVPYWIQREEGHEEGREPVSNSNLHSHS